MSTRPTTCVLVLLATGLLGCAQKAAELPPDYGSIRPARSLSAADFTAEDRALSCEEIRREWTKRSDAIERASAAIVSDRPRDQTAALLASLFFVPLLAVDTQEEQKAQISQAQARVDQLRSLWRWRDCASGSID